VFAQFTFVAQFDITRVGLSRSASLARARARCLKRAARAMLYSAPRHATCCFMRKNMHADIACCRAMLRRLFVVVLRSAWRR